MGVEGEVMLGMDVVAWGRFELAHYWDNVSGGFRRGDRGAVL